MGMAGPDIVLFVVGAVLFGGATYAIVALDGDVGSTSALGVFQVTYGAELTEIGAEDVASLRSATATFDLNLSAPLRAIVTVSCADGPGQIGAVPFTLQVAVEGPNGQTGEGNGQCGEDVLVEVPLGEMPPATSVSGRTEEEARANLPRSDGADAASGTWTVTVTGARASQQPVGLPVVDPAGTITFSVEEAAAQLAPVQR